jgi:PAS domain S-box-containing protein
MSEYVLAVLDNLDQSPSNEMMEKIFGLDDVPPREITKELLSSKKHSEVILDNISDGILEISTEGKIVFANTTARLLVGNGEDELLGSTFTELFDESHRRTIKEMMELNDAKPRKISNDASVILDGKEITLSILSVEDDEHQSLIVILNDVSEQKRLEAQLKRAEKMEAIGTLAGGVAHDLNNILSGLVSYPELLLMDIPQDSPFRKPILTILKSGEKAAAIVQDLLTLARRGVETIEVMNLNHSISEYLKSAEFEKLRSFHPNVQVDTHFDIDLLNIMGSSVHLAKTVMNLVSNAAEAMPSGGNIIITTQNRYIDSPISGYDDVEEGDYVTLTVSDSGVGISSADMERIFEPFYTKKVMGRSGTGLGMAVIWSTVKDHKGYIDALSDEGKGTTLTLYFPVTRKQLVKDQSPLSVEDFMGKGESILIVDDVAEQGTIASGMLQKLGYSVSSVLSGEDAVDYMKNNSADLLVLDMIMEPGIDGLETYKRILQLHPGQKAIIASGFSETYRVKEAQILGAEQYIKKPYTLEKIGLAVKNELSKQNLLTPPAKRY